MPLFELFVGLLAIAGLIILDIAALRWGVDTHTPKDLRAAPLRDI